MSAKDAEVATLPSLPFPSNEAYGRAFLEFTRSLDEDDEDEEGDLFAEIIETIQKRAVEIEDHMHPKVVDETERCGFVRKTKEPKINYAPVYCAMYPRLVKIAQTHGWALAVHGSMGRDFDLVAIPWLPECDDPFIVVSSMTEGMDLRRVGTVSKREHGRLIFTLSVGFGECALDLSFMPREMGEVNGDQQKA